MLSNEEFNVMKNQLVQLQTENDEITAKIGVLKDSNRQIVLIQQAIAGIKEDIEKSKAEYAKTIESLNNQLEDYQDGKVPSSIINTFYNSIAKLKNQEDLQLSNVKAKLESENSRQVELSQKEAELYEKIDNAASQEQLISNQIQDYNNFFNSFTILRPQIETCMGCGLFIQDLCAKLNNLKKERSVQSGRRFRLQNWKKRKNQDFQIQSDLMGRHQKDMDRIKEKSFGVEAQLHTLEVQLRNEVNALSKEEYDLFEANTEKEKYNKETEKLVNEAQEVITNIKTNTIPDIDNQINNIQSEINSYGLKKKKLLQKKMEMIRQLEKRIDFERQTLQRQDIVSPIVEELTNVEEQNLLEKEQIEKEIKQLEEQLRWYQANAEKKTLVIKELEKVVPLDQPVDEDTCLRMFYKSLDDVQVTNEALLNDLQMVGNELQGIEGENQSLKTILSQMEGPEDKTNDKDSRNILNNENENENGSDKNSDTKNENTNNDNNNTIDEVENDNNNNTDDIPNEKANNDNDKEEQDE